MPLISRRYDRHGPGYARATGPRWSSRRFALALVVHALLNNQRLAAGTSAVGQFEKEGSVARGNKAAIVGVLAFASALAVSCGDDLSHPAARRERGDPQPGVGGSIGSSSDGRGDAGAPSATDSGGGTGAGGMGGAVGTGGPAGPCADVFADDLFPTYELQIDAADWNALLTDFNSMQANTRREPRLPPVPHGWRSSSTATR